MNRKIWSELAPMTSWLIQTTASSWWRCRGETKALITIASSRLSVGESRLITSILCWSECNGGEKVYFNGSNAYFRVDVRPTLAWSAVVNASLSSIRASPDTAPSCTSSCTHSAFTTSTCAVTGTITSRSTGTTSSQVSGQCVGQVYIHDSRHDDVLAYF